MPNRDELRAKLKAAEKRRRRRADAAVATATSPAVATSSTKVDALDEIIKTTIAYCQAKACHVDAVAVTGLRAYLKQVTPQREQARGLFQRLSQLAEEMSAKHSNFTLRQFRDAVQQLIDTAKPYESGNTHDTRFLAYLELLNR